MEKVTDHNTAAGQTATLTPQAEAMMQQYLAFPIGKTAISIPYYNNRRGRVRGGLRAMIGKGSPADIAEEISLIRLRERLSDGIITAESAKKLAVENHIGIDCSGFSYHVLNAESIARGRGALRSHLTFPHLGRLRRMIARLRTPENTGVTVFAHPANSRVISISEIMPGDFITMTHEAADAAYDHIIIVTNVERADGAVTSLGYCNSIAWPTDGRYGHGVRRGAIAITNPAASRDAGAITLQTWTENGKTGEENLTFNRAKIAPRTEIRRFNWF